MRLLSNIRNLKWENLRLLQIFIPWVQLYSIWLLVLTRQRQTLFIHSETAIDININIMRAFVELRYLTQSAADNYIELRNEINNVKEYIEEILEDQNDINEEHRAQLDAISTALAELQNERPQHSKRRPIGFNPPKEDTEE